MLPDNWEVDNSLNPLVDDSALDPDSDGLTNLEEYTNGTDPQDNDSDNDLILDGWEVANSLNPLLNDSYGDADTDGLFNIEEFNLGTNPQNNDTDGDTFNDYDEVIAGTDPLDPLDYPIVVYEFSKHPAILFIFTIFGTIGISLVKVKRNK